MTQSPDEYGDVLRRVLRAEADTVVPSPEGLEIIRARIERRGVRNLFWWRAGAAAASAVLVAGTIVMVVPDLRHKVMQQDTIEPLGNSTSKPPANSSTSRPASPKPTRQPDDPPAVVPDPVTSVPLPASETAKSTSKPTPTPSSSEMSTPAVTCPAEECPPDDLDTTPNTFASPLGNLPVSTP